MLNSFISASLPALRQAQTEFQQAIPLGQVLLIDSTFGGVAKQVREGIPALLATQPEADELSYLQDIQTLGIPQEAKDIYSQFFGSHLDIKVHSIQTAEIPNLHSVSLIILTGSPANVTDGVRRDGMEVVPGLTHTQVLERENAIIQAAFKRHIPLIGLCYGHQSLSHVLGGTVGRLNGRIFGTAKAHPTKEGLSYLKNLHINVSAFQNTVPAYHQDFVSRVPKQSTSLFEANTQYGVINYGTVHGTTAISVQYHPEYLFIEPLLTSLRTQQLIQLPTSVESSIETLRLFAAFLKARVTG